jgi:hypothetical protein
MDIGQLALRAPVQKQRLAEARDTIGDQIAWYPYDILGNLPHLDLLLSGDNRDLDSIAGVSLSPTSAPPMGISRSRSSRNADGRWTSSTPLPPT